MILAFSRQALKQIHRARSFEVPSLQCGAEKLLPQAPVLRVTLVREPSWVAVSPYVQEASGLKTVQSQGYTAQAIPSTASASPTY